MAIAQFGLVALDCPDPLALAMFYQQIVGGDIVDESESDGWVTLQTGTAVNLGFQLDPQYQPPGWPDGSPQQAHLDFSVPDLDTSETAVLAIGARKTELQPEPTSWRVYLDPAGHPFCLVKA